MKLITAVLFCGLVSRAFSAGLHALVTNPLGGIGYVVRGPGASQYHGASIGSIQALGLDYRGAGAYSHGHAGSAPTGLVLGRFDADYQLTGVGGGSALLAPGSRGVGRATLSGSGARGSLAGHGVEASESHRTAQGGAAFGSVMLGHHRFGHAGATLVGQVPGVVVTETQRVGQAGLTAGQAGATLVSQVPGAVVTGTQRVAQGGSTLVGQAPGSVVVTETTRGAGQSRVLVAHAGNALVGHVPGAVVTETTHTRQEGAFVGHGGGAVVSHTPGVVVTETRQDGLLVGHDPGARVTKTTTSGHGAVLVRQTPGAVVTETTRIGHPGAVFVGHTPGVVVTETTRTGHPGSVLVSQTPGAVVTETTRTSHRDGVIVGQAPGAVVTEARGTSGYLVGHGGVTVLGRAPGAVVTEGRTTTQQGAVVGSQGGATLVGQVPGTVVTENLGVRSGQAAVVGQTQGHTVVTTHPGAVVVHGTGTIVDQGGYGFFGVGGTGYGVTTTPGNLVYRPDYGYGAAYRTAHYTVPGYTVTPGLGYGVHLHSATSPVAGLSAAFQPVAGLGYRTHTVAAPTYIIRHTPAHGQRLFGYGYGLGGFRYGVPVGFRYVPGTAQHTTAQFGLRAIALSTPSTVANQTPGVVYHAVSAPSGVVHHVPLAGHGLYGYGFGLGGHRYNVPAYPRGHAHHDGLLFGRGAASHVALYAPTTAVGTLGRQTTSSPVALVHRNPALSHASYDIGGVRYNVHQTASSVLQNGAYTVSGGAPTVTTYRYSSPTVTYHQLSPTVTYHTTYSSPVTYSAVPAGHLHKT